MPACCDGVTRSVKPAGAAMTACMSIDEGEGRSVAIISGEGVAQSCTGRADTVSALPAAAGSLLS